MKYRWTTQIMTRDSGMLSVYCKDRQQASENVSRFSDCRIKNSKTMELKTIQNYPNILLVDEIIWMAVCDNELMADVHLHEVREHEKIHKEAEFSQNDDETE